MDWMEEVQGRIKRKNQILFSKNSEYLQDLLALIETQNHRTMVLWAFEFAEEAVQTLNERYPEETRPNEAVAASRAWAAGKVKMPVAQRAILQAHAFAKEIASQEDIALCHAVGQACGVVHAKGHAIGFPVYELTALIRRYGFENCREPVERRKRAYMERMLFWQDEYENHRGEWADFLLAE